MSKLEGMKCPSCDGIIFMKWIEIRERLKEYYKCPHCRTRRTIGKYIIATKKELQKVKRWSVS